MIRTKNFEPKSEDLLQKKTKKKPKKTKKSQKKKIKKRFLGGRERNCGRNPEN